MRTTPTSTTRTTAARLAGGLLACSLAASAVAGTTAAPARAAAADVPVQLLSITDFHSGDPMPSQVAGLAVRYRDGRSLPFAGTEYLVGELRRDRAAVANTITFSNGDNFTAYNWADKGTADEYGIEKYEQLGMEFSVVGNHDLDWRVDHMRTHLSSDNPCPVTGFVDCLPTSTGDRFDGIKAPYISSNLKWRNTGENIWQAYQVREFTANGRTYKVGVIGATVTGAEGWPMSFNDTVSSTSRSTAINQVSDELAAQGVTAQVLSLHDGALKNDNLADTCDGLGGPAVDVARVVRPRIGAIIAGDSHRLVNCTVPGPDGVARPVLQSGVYGQAYGRTTIVLDAATGAIKPSRTVAELVPVSTDVAPDAHMNDIKRYWTDYAASRGARTMARATGPITLSRSSAGEHAVGDVAADALLWSSRQQPNPAADLALTSTTRGSATSGWDAPTHKDLTGARSSDGTYTLTYQDSFGVYGLDHKVVTGTYTGQQLLDALEAQWTSDGGFHPLAVSANVRYTWDARQPVGHRVVAGSATVDQTAISPTRTYRVALPAGDVMMGGRNGNTPLTEGTSLQAHMRLDDQTFVNHLRALGTVPVPTPRVTRIG